MYAVPQLDLSCLSVNSDDDNKLFTTTVRMESNWTRIEKYLMKLTFNAWYNLIYNIKIQFTMLQAKNEFHLKKTYFNYWKLKIHQINYNRDIEKAKIDSIEIIKKEYKAKQFHENFRLKQCFTRWSCTIRMEKSTRDQLEKESFRREKEIEFLNHLDTLMNNHQTKTLTSGNDNNTTTNNNSNNNNQDNETIPLGNRICLTDRKSQKSKTVNTNNACLKSANSSPSVEDLISGDFTLDHYKSDRKVSPLYYFLRNNRILSAQSSVMKPILNQTIIQQRNIIAAQNREINALKAAHRYSEWLLEARAHKLAKTIIEKTNTKINEADKSSPELNESPVHVENGTDDQVHSQLIIISFTHLEMEERAAERARRRALQEERRRENEQKKKEQLAKQLEEEANRIKQEKIMLKNEQKEKKIREEEVVITVDVLLITMHRNMSCLRYYGLKPWINYVLKQHELIQMANCYEKKTIMRNTFHTWLLHLKIKYEQETKFVQCHYNVLLMKKTIKALQKREREYRREQFRKCLLDIIPDFNPPKQDINEMD
uniref:Uncharacterized protein n=1 Tax=Schistosoma haematobium TaxID=6185 RepID=A0A094ZRR3_SCHHA